MAKKSKKKSTNTTSAINPDIMILLVLAISVIIFISTLGLCGIVGVGVQFLVFGLFGILGYAVAFVLFFMTAYIMANKGNKILRKRIIAISCLFIFVCAFCQLVMIGYSDGYSLQSCFIDSVNDHLGGGLLGGAVVKALCMLIGFLGTGVVLIIGIIICMIVITQKPLVSNVKKSTQEAYGKARDKKKQLEQEREENEIDKKPSSKRRKNKETDDLLAEDEPEKTNKKDSVFDQYMRSGKSDRKKTTRVKSPVDDFSISGELEEINDSEKATDEEPEVPIKTPVRRTRVRSEASDKGRAETAAINESLIQASNKSQSVGKNYKTPPLKLLAKGTSGNKAEIEKQTRITAKKLQQTLDDFGVNAKVVSASCGPTVTRYELRPEQGVKVSRIVNLSDDIKLSLAAADIRIEAPIPGKSAVGIEVPNKSNIGVSFRELIESEEFRQSKAGLAFAVGKNLAGKTVVSDIAKMPHLLIAGATGSGKSVCINTLIMSILYRYSPDDVKFIMVDPKVVELSVYNGIPHLLSPVVTDPRKAAGTLQWAVAEMTRRYNAFAEFHVRDINSYNKKVESFSGIENENEEAPKKMPKIVIVVDELADLMMAAPGEVEESICRLAQLARAAGLHLVIATQRPSVNVITGLIKANMPSRIALSVTSGTDSRVILDMNGAEKLLGKGDMLFYPAGYQKPARVQGAYISDEEIQNVVQYLKDNCKDEIVYEESLNNVITLKSGSTSGSSADSADADVLFADAGKLIIEKDKASIGMLQRAFKIGFNRAARIMDQLCDAGVVGEEEGTKPRKILMSMEQFENYLEEN